MLVQPLSPSQPDRAASRAGLASALASRICHDLVSPLGAIANGLELMALTLLPSPEGDLIAESVAAANARMRFFRLAYGPAAPSQATSRAEVTATLQAITRGGRTAYEWEVPGDQPRAEVRLVMLVLHCLESAMPMGGQVRVGRDGDAWVVIGEGPSLRLDEGPWLSLHRPGTLAESPSLIQFAFLAELLGEAGKLLALERAEGRVTIRV